MRGKQSLQRQAEKSGGGGGRKEGMLVLKIEESPKGKQGNIHMGDLSV